MSGGWEWEAGPLCGITGELRAARRHAAAALRSGAAESAVLQLVGIVTESRTLEDRYVPLPCTRLVGRRTGAGVRWEPAPPGPC